VSARSPKKKAAGGRVLPQHAALNLLIEQGVTYGIDAPDCKRFVVFCHKELARARTVEQRRHQLGRPLVVITVPLHRGRAAIAWAKAEIAPLWALLGAGILALGFGLLAEEVFEGSAARLDSDVLVALRTSGDLSDPLGPPWLEEAARDLTSLGSHSVLGLIVLASVFYLLLVGKGRTALLVVAAVAGGVLLVTALKIGFARPRPDIVPPLARVFTASFPSSHAALSASVYLTLGALFAHVAAAARAAKIYLVILAVLLTVVVGASRVYLGLHYPTDVLAGWCVGAAWAMLCWAAALYLQSRGKIGSAGGPVP